MRALTDRDGIVVAASARAKSSMLSVFRLGLGHGVRDGVVAVTSAQVRSSMLSVFRLGLGHGVPPD